MDTIANNLRSTRYTSIPVLQVEPTMHISWQSFQDLTFQFHDFHFNTYLKHGFWFYLLVHKLVSRGVFMSSKSKYFSTLVDRVKNSTANVTPYMGYSGSHQPGAPRLSLQEAYKLSCSITESQGCPLWRLPLHLSHINNILGNSKCSQDFWCCHIATRIVTFSLLHL